MARQLATQIELFRGSFPGPSPLALMIPDVVWQRALKGGFVHGPEEVRADWTGQWSEINPQVEPVGFHPESADRILVDVYQPFVTWREPLWLTNMSGTASPLTAA